MRILKNKFIFKLISSICLVLLLLNVCPNNKLYAEDEEVWGSVLLKPITNLLVGLGDGIVGVIHKTVMEQDETIIKISGDKDWWAFWKGVLVAVAIVVAMVIIAVVAYGA